MSLATAHRVAPSVAGQTNPTPFVLISATGSGVPANGASTDAAVSRDGARVVFRSEATDLLEPVDGGGADESGFASIYARDLAADGGQHPPAIVRVGVVWDGDQVRFAPTARPAISGNGRVVAFRSTSGGRAGEAEDVGLFAAVLPDGPLLRGAAMPPLERIDRGTDGGPANGLSAAPALSADGRYVAFHSHASNLTAGDDNGAADVFVHDRATGATIIASTAHTGGAAHGDSRRPWLSGDGSVIVFESDAPDLVAPTAGGDPPGRSPASTGRVDVFLRPLPDGPTVRLSDVRGAPDPAVLGAVRDRHSAIVSADGRSVLFAVTDVDTTLQGRDRRAVHLYDRRTGRTSRIEAPPGDEPGDSPGRDRTHADQPALSPNGHRIAFRAVAASLGVGTPPPTQRHPHLSLHLLDRFTTARRAWRWPEPPAISEPAPSVTLRRGALADVPFAGPPAGMRAGLVFSTSSALFADDANTVADVYAVVAGVAREDVRRGGTWRLAIPAAYR